MKYLVAFLLILLFASVACAEQSYVAVDEAAASAIEKAAAAVAPENNSGSGATSSRGGTVTVQRVNSYAYLRDYDHVEIEKYLAAYRKRLHPRNYEALRVGLPQIIGNSTVDARDRNGKLILNQSPAHYLALIQSYYGVTAGTDWYVNFPGFTGGGSQGPLVLDDVPGCTGGSVVCATACSPGALQASHAGSKTEVTVAAGWASFKDVDKQPPPPGPECPPGNPPAKPPTSGPIGDPSGPEPNGPPAAGGPPPPTGAQAPVQIGDGTGIAPPTPVSLHVADPVTVAH